MPLENKYPTGCECREKPETMDDILNEIIGLAFDNKNLISDISNSLRSRSDEDCPVDDDKMPKLDKFEKLDLIRRVLRDSNATARGVVEVLG